MFQCHFHPVPTCFFKLGMVISTLIWESRAVIYNRLHLHTWLYVVGSVKRYKFVV